MTVPSSCHPGLDAGDLACFPPAAHKAVPFPHSHTPFQASAWHLWVLLWASFDPAALSGDRGALRDGARL